MLYVCNTICGEEFSAPIERQYLPAFDLNVDISIPINSIKVNKEDCNISIKEINAQSGETERRRQKRQRGGIIYYIQQRMNEREILGVVVIIIPP